jgi:hypothetical protein
MTMNDKKLAHLLVEVHSLADYVLVATLEPAAAAAAAAMAIRSLQCGRQTKLQSDTEPCLLHT